ncbi:protein translocase subunit SecD [Pyrinomonas methylaliphatogenes]|uniref:Protein translocase subunit SecD n=1 Tax=Pyrinomonas methylaliphatogenes TaxID=454194 RepID=A0A0B6WZY7_9BACT|nr:protein translocase subunit SecD [Pyrinomonas methylaliphatogenes]CDM66287.1 protein-export membrane protein, SecD/SecF family [Pyrinomonas methylaliphatogenes]
MRKDLTQRVVIIAIITVIAIYVVFGPHHRPTWRDFTLAGIRQNLAENIHLGLDLRGGSHLVMQVKTEEYLKRLTENTAIGVQNAAKDAGIGVRQVRPEVNGDDYRVVLELEDASKASDARSQIERKVDLNGWTASVSGNTVTWTLTAAAKRTLSDQAVEQALRIIESRINLLGVTEPTLQRHGAPESHQILLQMPGVQDPERIKAILVGESRLELMHVISPPNPSPVQTYATKEEAIQALGGTVPSNRQVLPYTEREEPTATGEKRAQRWVIVETPAIIDGSELRNAEAVSRTGRSDDYQVAFTLKPSGAEKFARWTGANINQYLAVVLNGEVKSIAYIKSQISDAGEISGRFTKQSAEDLALTLRSGALPAPLVYLEERTVGPSLGADSIRAGITASVIGLLLVVLVMIVYYRGSGVNAVVALLLNIVLTMAALILFGATLTLPGIAGIILGIGMAVDSNVLIFERIREELRTGKTVASAIEQGFARAFVTIIDTHVTTIVSSLFLFVFGTGPIRGFAVTLILGLAANLFTAVYVSRTIFIWLLNRSGGRLQTLSI